MAKVSIKVLFPLPEDPIMAVISPGLLINKRRQAFMSRAGAASLKWRLYGSKRLLPYLLQARNVDKVLPPRTLPLLRPP